MAKPRQPYECQPCGACCRNPLFNREHGLTEYVQVFPTDALFKLKGLRTSHTFGNENNELHMRLTEDGHCVALEGETGKHTACGVYELRPGVCRRVQPGDDKCIIARRERGLPV